MEKSKEAIKFEVISQIERRLELENLYPTSPYRYLNFHLIFLRKLIVLKR